MDSFIAAFHIDWKIIIAQAINFGVVLGVFYFFALKPIKKLMRERKERIEKGLVDAKHNENMLELTQKESEEIIAKVRAEGHELWKEAKDEAELKKQKMLEDAKVEVQAMLDSTRKILESEKARILDEAKLEVTSLVIRATEKILEDDIDHSFTDKQLKHIKEA